MPGIKNVYFQMPKVTTNSRLVVSDLSLIYLFTISIKTCESGFYISYCGPALFSFTLKATIVLLPTPHSRT